MANAAHGMVIAATRGGKTMWASAQLKAAMIMVAAVTAPILASGTAAVTSRIVTAEVLNVGRVWCEDLIVCAAARKRPYGSSINAAIQLVFC